MSVEISFARPGDERGLAEQMKLVVDEDRWLGTQRNATVDELTERFRAELADSENILLALRDGDRIVGAIGIQPTRIDGVVTLGISIVAEYRGQGWGRRLIDAAVSEARRRGVRKVTLEVWPDNGRALALYSGAGFVIEGYKRDHYPRLDGTLRSSVLMALFL